MSIQILIFHGTQNIKTLFIHYIVLYLTHSACQNFGIDYMNLINTVKESDAWTNFSTELEAINSRLLKQDSKNSRNFIFLDDKMKFQISYLELQRSFHRKFLFYWLLYSNTITQTTSSLNNRITVWCKKKKESPSKYMTF